MQKKESAPNQTKQAWINEDVNEINPSKCMAHLGKTITMSITK
jgi:hypothetical protein